MKNHLRVRMAGLAAVLILSLPAGAETEFRARKMTRGDVPLGKGQCDIRLRVDAEVEVSVRGDVVSIRTISGRDPRDDGSECNEPLPDRTLEGFTFEVLDRRNDMVLLAEPSRRNGFRAIVRIRDSEGGEGRYHFRLSWRMTGGGYGSDYGGGADPRDQGRSGTSGMTAAMDACRGAVSQRIADQYRVDNLAILNIRVDNGPGRNDVIIGEATGRRGRGRASFSFACRVDLNSGRVRTVDVRMR